MTTESTTSSFVFQDPTRPFSERVQLAPGTSRTLSFTITPEMMMLINDEGQAVLEPGQFKLTIGGCSPSTRGLALGASEPVGTTFAVV